MFQKVRFQMFFLCGCITSLVLLGMALFTLSISEGNLRENHYQSFQQDITTMSYNLEQQVVITHQWLKNIESQGKYTLYVIDNHTPYLFNVLNSTEDEVRLFEEAYMHYQDSFSIDSNNLTAFTILHDEFTFRDSLTRKQYYASILLLERNANPLEILVLANTEDLRLQITNQRTTFSFIILFALLCLWIFSYLFTSIILKPLQKNQEEQVAFISAASHELRTPLAVIQSYLSAKEKGALPEGAPFLTILKNECSRMSKLVEDLLFLSRTELHQWSMQFDTYTADTILMNVYEAFETLAKEKQLKLNFLIPDDTLPPIVCDRIRLEQVLAILIENAIHYTPDGGSITLSVCVTRKTVHFYVIDTGIGIPSSERKKIFTRFYRCSQSRTEKEHFGLGLTIAAEIVHAHKGQISVNETPGGGSTFIVEIPLSFKRNL